MHKALTVACRVKSYLSLVIREVEGKTGSAPMERQNCLMILFFIILGGYGIILSTYVIIFGD